MTARGRGGGDAGEWTGTPWEELERPGPDAIEIGGVEVRRGSRVRLKPRSRGDVFDVVLAGRVAVVEKIEKDMEEQIQLAVVVEDDPGRDLGERRQPGHRFFFAPEEVEPLGGTEGAGPATVRVLVAGIGNVFLGDDGFGVALANRLAEVELPQGVDVVDFGIRGMDLAWAMQDGYDAVVLLDATPRGEAPGTLYLIEPEVAPGAHAIEAHGMDPVKVLSLVQALGGSPPRTLVVGCEPQTRMDPGDEELVADLSEPVRLALDEGVRMVESVLAELGATKETERSAS
jgi:hydrogenase maturation protease